MSRRKAVAGLLAALAVAVSAPASAVAFGGPNSPGNSGHFQPQSNPCQGSNDHPHCPGPH
jgi:hypothetical protein